MPWFKVDDNFADHPKLECLEATPIRYMAAVTVWVLMGADCARRMTGGKCKFERVRKVCSALGRRAELGAEALVAADLWERDEHGYQFKHWDEYQPAKTEIERKRARKTARQQRWREGVRRRDVDASVDRLRDGAVAMVPTRPDPKERIEISDHTHSAPASPRARAPEGPAEHSVRVCEENGFTAERMSRIFQREYLAARKTLPSMGGRNVGEFHRRVLATAEARNTDPEALFTAVLTRYLAEPPTNIGKIAPYANFASQFDVLIEPDDKAQKSAELERFRAEVSQMLPSSRKAAHNGP